MSDGPILDQINLVVSDVEATVKFYRRLGVSIPDTDPAFQLLTAQLSFRVGSTGHRQRGVCSPLG